MKLSGKSAIVTGGASGIGQATSRLFAEEGASVVIADFSEAGEEHAKRLRDDGHQAIFFKVDVTKEDQIQELIEHTVHAFGKLDIMFANAGVANDDPADRLSLEKWQKTIDVNLTGVFLSDKYALIQMLKQGTKRRDRQHRLHTRPCRESRGHRLRLVERRRGHADPNPRHPICLQRYPRQRGMPRLYRNAAA